jgi:glutamate dehydrogenase
MADVSIRTGATVEQVTEAYGQLGEILSLEAFTAQIIFLSSDDRWEDFARESFMDELEGHFRALVVIILDQAKEQVDMDSTLLRWQQNEKALIRRWQDMVKEVKNATEKNFAMVSVALRELNALLESTRLAFEPDRGQ